MLRPETAGSEGQSRGEAKDPLRRFRLVLADDHRDVREEVRSLLGSEFEVLRTVGEGAALVEAAAELRPDAVIADIQMPRMGGIEAGQQLLNRGLCQAVVVCSMYPDGHLVKTALDAGIRAYVLKVDAGEELIPAIYAALRGERYLSRGIRHVTGDR